MTIKQLIIALSFNVIKVFRLRFVSSILRFLPKNIRYKVKALKFLYYDRSLVPEKMIKRKFREALLFLIKKIGSNSLGDYMEFGVYSGTSIACMYHTLKDLNLDRIRLFGFDSFEGFPNTKSDNGFFRPGDLKCDIEVTKMVLTWQNVNWDQIILIKGWFSETLDNKLINEYDIKKASVIMVDCDMYQSAKEALNFCKHLIQDVAVIFFDDWHLGDLDKINMGEKRAFEEFLRDNPQFSIESFGNYHKDSEVFIISRK